MKRLDMLGLAFIACLSLLHLTAAHGQGEDDIFAFIPSGGRTLLEAVREGGLPESLAANFAETQADAAAWRETLDAAMDEAPALGELDSWETDTLAHYITWRAPFDPSEELPRDGRDMALQLCQSCHIITVVVTQEKTREAWLGTMNSPIHIEITTSEAERELLGDYLVLKAGIPIVLVPPALRAGGASY